MIEKEEMMFKLYKKFKFSDWVGVILIVALTILQVYCTMTMVDFMQEIIKSITMLNYHNNPGLISEQMKSLVDTFGWDKLSNVEFLVSLGIPQEATSTFIDISKASTTQIWSNGGLMLAFAGGTIGCQMLISIIASYVAADLSTAIRRDLYNKVENFSLAEINDFSTPSLITRSTNDIQNVQMANLMIMRMIFAAPVTAIWAIIKIQASSMELTVATAISIVVLVVFLIIVMVVALPKFKIMQKLTDRINGVTRENLTGIRIVRAYNAEEYQEDKFTKANNDMTNLQVFAGRVTGLMNPVMMLIMNGISLAIYWIGASLINKGTIDFATTTAFMTLSSQIIMSFLMLMMMFLLWPRATICANRINEVLNKKSSIIDPKEEKKLISEGEVEFRNVSFRYVKEESNVVSNISFKVNKGETIAFIGSTGSGKTSLINLIPRIYDCNEGEVLVDGINVKDIKQSTLRSLIGFVPQKNLLFRGTIKENVKFSNKDISDEEMVNACKVAEAEEFIEKLEDKYESRVSQGGKNFSGGQKQRLCIARAIASRPEILVFDDSFSALDYKTDKKVRNNLNEKFKGVTKFIVAQRIGTIMDADKIVVLEDGKMVGYGKHKELLSSCEVYKEIALSQLSKEELGL